MVKKSKKKKKVPSIQLIKTPKNKKINKSPYRSFVLCKEEEDFITFRVTKQTIYWSIFLIYMLLISLWVLNAQLSTMILLV